MTMVNPTSMPRRGGLVRLYSTAMEGLDALPLSFVQLVSRLAVAHVFWQSSQSKLASWPVTIQLFTYEYNLPIIDPGVAAVMATAAELSGAALMFLGLFSRLSALMLLGVLATIQILVYPDHWGEHLTWAAPLFLILARGGGVLSLDHVAARIIRRER